LWVSLVSFATITLCVASRRVFISLQTQTRNFCIHPRKRFSITKRVIGNKFNLTVNRHSAVLLHNWLYFSWLLLWLFFFLFLFVVLHPGYKCN
jgi:hypothetical protein